MSPPACYKLKKQKKTKNHTQKTPPALCYFLCHIKERFRLTVYSSAESVLNNIRAMQTSTAHHMSTIKEFFTILNVKFSA